MEQAVLELGRGVHHSPQLAAHGDTVVLLVMQVESGIYNRLRLLRVGSDGIVDEVPLAADAAPSVTRPLWRLQVSSMRSSSGSRG